MNIEEIARKNTDDIHALTVNMTRMAAIQESSEKRHEDMREMVKSSAEVTLTLNEKLNEALAMKSEIISIKETLADRTGDIRTLRHDLGNALSGLSAIGPVNDKAQGNSVRIAELSTDMKTMKEWKDKMEGAMLAIKGTWIAIGAGIVYLVIHYVRTIGTPGT